MKKFILILCGILVGAGCVFADVFSNPAKVENIVIPDFDTVSCKFSQTKTIPNSTAEIKSGGDFKFVKEEGVIFETTFPVQMITTYSSAENKRISSIISAINKKDYSYLNRNFSIFYENNANGWTLGLKPKAESKINSHLSSIVIRGNIYITGIDINTLKTGSTKINFTECR